MNQALLHVDPMPETFGPAATGRKRNLGGAVVLAAIQDYRSLRKEVHLDAAGFLYPQTAECRMHFDWVVSMADELNGAWLRDALDRCRPQWICNGYSDVRLRGTA